jgi:hypothetical protein
MNAQELRGQLAWWSMKLQPYKFKVVYCVGTQHANANTMTHPPVGHMEETNMVCIALEWSQPARHAAIAGCEFVWLVATDPYSNQVRRTWANWAEVSSTPQQEDMSGMVGRENANVEEEEEEEEEHNKVGPSPGVTNRAAPDWPMDEDWENNWPPSEDWSKFILFLLFIQPFYRCTCTCPCRSWAS